MSGLGTGETLVKAWLTVKKWARDPDPGLIQKVITVANVPGVGQITDAGASGTGAVRFDLVPSDTSGLEAGRRYLFDVQVLTSAGEPYTPCVGVLVGLQGVTQTTS